MPFLPISRTRKPAPSGEDTFMFRFFVFKVLSFYKTTCSCEINLSSSFGRGAINHEAKGTKLNPVKRNVNIKKA